MDLACMLYHGGKADMPVEVMRHPHLELVASDEHERRVLKTVADQLKQFGCVPFSFKEIDGAAGLAKGAVLRIALCERPAGGMEETCAGASSVNPPA